MTETPTGLGGEYNPPVMVYDTSGVYTDPDVQIDLNQGLPSVRQTWIEERDDTDVLSSLSSDFGQARLKIFVLLTFVLLIFKTLVELRQEKCYANALCETGHHYA